ncbi:MAG: hypothetical protein LBE91_00530 [Tannerella sp.]|jgi:ABC-type sugar transport system permease subunit|nr:hypothetical protein [Tannerella sp.]
MKKDAEHVFRDLKDGVTKYAELRLELLKLNTYEQVSKMAAFFSYGLLLSALTLITILFVHLVLGFFLSKLLDSLVFGFGIITILYILQVILVIVNRKRIQEYVINKIIKAFHYYEDKIEETFDGNGNRESEQGTVAF